MKSKTYHWFLWITSHAKLILFGFTLSVPFVAFGALGALRSTSNDPRQWLPRSFAETDKYDWFQECFGNDEAAVVSWTDCTVNDPRVEILAKALEESPFFEQALTGPRVYRQLMAKPLSVPSRYAAERLQGVLIGKDRRTTCLVLISSKKATADRSAAVAAIYELANSTCQLEASSLHLAGPTVDAAAIDAESRHLLFQLAGISALVSFCVAAIRLKSIWLAGIVLVSAAYSTGLALSVLYFSGGEMNLLMTMLPPLIYVLSISAAVHLANYYRDAVGQFSIKEVAAHAAEHGWLPCLLAAITTSIGLISLVISKIDPIRTFGLYSAAGVMFSLIVVFLFLPSALHLFSSRIEPPNMLSNRRWVELGNRVLLGIQAKHVLIVMLCLVLLFAGGAGLLGVQSTVRLQARFLPNSPVLADYRWLERNVGPMVPLEIVIHFEKESPLDLLQRIKLLEKIQRRIQGLPIPLATLSAVDFVPPIPKGGGVRQVVERRLMNRRLEAGIASLVEARFLADTEEEQLWRISVRANAISNLDYGQFADRLRRQVDPLLADAQIRATYTGVIPLIYKAQRQLLQDLVRSFCTAFAVIAVILAIVLRSVPAAILAMVPNLFPAVVVFGGMGWLQIPVQIGSVMTASAALGIAVDDTVHFLTWFRRGLDRGMPHLETLSNSFQRCAGAMVHTTIICSSGLLVFSASSFVPILHFAWLMVLLLLAALVGDLVFLPAILAGPLGSCFKSSRASSDHKNPESKLTDVSHSST
jgi:hypothetical protein